MVVKDLLDKFNIDPQRAIEKISAAVVYAILSSVALNFFLQPGKVYSSGVTGLAQIIDRLISNSIGHELNGIAWLIWVINIPLLILAWLKLGKKFTIYTLISISLSTLLIQYTPKIQLTTDPIMSAIFGGAIMGLGIGVVMRTGLSSGGMDIVSLTLRKKTGRSVGLIGMLFNGIIMLLAGILFGWQYMFYSMVTVFVNSQVTDAVFNKQKKMQVTIVTKRPNQVTKRIQDKLTRGVTIVNEVQGGYSRESSTLLLTIITADEVSDFKDIMRASDPKAFVSISENVKIMGNFSEHAD